MGVQQRMMSHSLCVVEILLCFHQQAGQVTKTLPTLQSPRMLVFNMVQKSVSKNSALLGWFEMLVLALLLVAENIL